MTICDWPAWMAIVLRVVKDREGFMFPSPPLILLSVVFCPPHVTVSSASPAVMTAKSRILLKVEEWKKVSGFCLSLFFWDHFMFISVSYFFKWFSQCRHQQVYSFQFFFAAVVVSCVDGLFLFRCFLFSLVFIVGNFTFKVPQQLLNRCVVSGSVLFPVWSQTWVSCPLNVLQNRTMENMNKRKTVPYITPKNPLNCLY